MKEFFDARVTFGHKAFEKGHELGRLECQNQVIECYQGLDLSFLDDGESEGESSNGVSTPPILIEASPDVPAIVSKATPTEPIATEPFIAHEIALVNPATMAGPSIANPKEVEN